MKVLVFNAGSSSLKYALFEVVSLRAKRSNPLRSLATLGMTQSVRLLRRNVPLNDIRVLYRGQFDNHGAPIKNFETLVHEAVQALITKKFITTHGEIKAIGHRVVHGGTEFVKPTPITARVITTLKKLSPLAPLHNPPNIDCIEACIKIFPRVRELAVFDTAFHATMPEEAKLYGLPYKMAKKLAIHRYGFHGISHQYVFEQAQKKLGRAATRRTVTCHLGNGCSITAIKNGKVIDTSMGFTPLEGVPMGTRSGDLDPAIIFYLLKHGWSADEIEDMLTKKSGLLGVSELSSDVRDLWVAYQKKDPRAMRALNWFAYRIAKYIGAYAVALGGLDCIVFTGGTGENAWYLRKWVLAHLKHLTKKRVLVIKTDEEKKIAELLGQSE